MPRPGMLRSGAVGRASGSGGTLPVVAAVAGALLALPVVAGADHWSTFGGDAGHSGNQPIDATAMPVGFRWVAADAGARTSVVTSTGTAATDRIVAYGVQSGASAFLRTRRLMPDGGTIGTSQDIDGDPGEGDGGDADVFGPAPRYGVTPVETSGPGGLGQIYAVHNDTDSVARLPNGCLVESAESSNDIAIAQVDEATGALNADAAVGPAASDPLDPSCSPGPPQLTDGYTVESSPVITPPDVDGTRRLAFIAGKDGGGAARLFVVRIENAGAAAAVIHAEDPEYRDIPDANPKVSPSLVYLRNAGQAATVAYLAVAIDAAGGAAKVRTFDAADPANEGPATAGDVAGTPTAISVPVTASGAEPGRPGSGVQKAPAMYVAFVDTNATPGDPSDDTTQLHKYVQVGDANVLSVPAGTASESLPGATAQGVAVSTIATGDSSSATEGPGEVVVATGKNVYVLDATTLGIVDRLRDDGESLLTPGSSGFSRTVPAVSGDYVYAVADGGGQRVLGIGDGEPVPSGDFAENALNSVAGSGTGQPSISHGFVGFVSDAGVFVYQTAIAPANEAPVVDFTLTPNPAAPNAPVAFDAGASSDSDGSIQSFAWDRDGDGSFEANTGATPTTTASYAAPGIVQVSVRVTDDDGAATTLTKELVVTAPPDGGPSGPATTSTVATPPAIPGPPGTSCAPRRCDASGLTATVTPRRDRKLPYVFKVTGRLRLPVTVRPTEACLGRVVVLVKRGKRSVVTKRAAVGRDCRYRAAVTVRDRRRIGRARSLKVVVRFDGNALLNPCSAPARSIRVG